MLIQIFYIAFLMFVWFETDAFVEYSKLFRLSRFFKIDDWEKYREINTRIDYLGYLRIKHCSFFVKLISCKHCLCVWLVLITCSFFDTFVLFPIVYILAYWIYVIFCKASNQLIFFWIFIFAIYSIMYITKILRVESPVRLWKMIQNREEIMEMAAGDVYRVLRQFND